MKNIKRTLIKLAAIAFGFVFGLIVILPWPWRMRALLSKWINDIRSFGLNKFTSSVIDFVEDANVKYQMGKGHGVNTSIIAFNWVVRDADGKDLLSDSKTKKELTDLVASYDFQHMTPKEYQSSIDAISKKIESMVNREKKGVRDG